MAELRIEENENDSCKKEKISADDTGNKSGEAVRDILTALEAD